MGRDKAFMTWRGKALIDWVYEALEPVCSEMLISSNVPADQFPDRRVIADRFKDIGPIAGIESGLYHASNPSVVFCSCDTPGVCTDLFSHLIAKHRHFDISLAAHHGIDQPMIGIYQRSTQSFFAESIRQGNTKPPRAIKALNWQAIEIGPQLNFYQNDLFLNLNTPQDVKNNEYDQS